MSFQDSGGRGAHGATGASRARDQGAVTRGDVPRVTTGWCVSAQQKLGMKPNREIVEAPLTHTWDLPEPLLTNTSFASDAASL